MKKEKKRLSLILAAVSVCSLLIAPAPAASDTLGVSATPVQYTLSAIAGENVSLWAYEIDGNVYFKLRDLAMALNGTEKQFGISWDGSKNAVALTIGTAYIPVGGELSEPSTATATVAPAPTTIFYIDGRQIPMRFYVVNDAHYIMLPDLADNMMFASGRDEERHMVKISPKAYYTGLYSFSLPEGWSASGSPYDLSFTRAGESVGSFIIRNYDPDNPIAQFEDNHRTTLSSEDLSGFDYPAAKAIIRATQPAAANDDSCVDELHIYIMLPDLRCAFDFCFDSAKVDEQAAVGITKDFVPKESAIKMNTIAAQWARAIQNRDGHTQYALLSAELQSEFKDYYESNHWVTGLSSPWVNSYTVEIVGNRAVVFYEDMTSEGFAGYGIDNLSFAEENGQLKISGLDGENNLPGYNTSMQKSVQWPESGVLLASPPDEAVSAPWKEITYGAGEFDSPCYIAADGFKNVYVADSGHDQIKKLASGSTAWTDITGDGGFSHPAGVAADGSGNLYVTDEYNRRIKKLASGSTAWTDITHDGGFSRPSGIAAGSSGDVYVADTLPGRIKKLTSGSTTWKDITYDGGFSHPNGVVVDNSGNLCVADGQKNFIKKLASGSTTWADITYGQGFDGPVGLAADGHGDIFVSDSGQHQIKRLASGNTCWTDVTNGGGFGYPFGLAVDSSGNLYAADAGHDQIKQLASGSTSWIDITHATGFKGPNGLAVDNSGNVYTADSGHDLIKVLASGSTVWEDITGDESFSWPAGVAVDGSGNLYVTDTMHDQIKKLASGSTAWTDITHDGGFSRPSGIAAGSSGDVYVADTLPGRIKKLTSGSTTWADITYGQGFGIPVGVAVDGSGNLYVTDTYRNQIKELASGSTAWTDITQGGGFNRPRGVAVDGSGNLYVTDTENHRIKKLASGSTAWTDITQGGDFDQPRSLAVDGRGNLYVADTFHDQIKELAAPGAALAAAAGEATVHPQ